ncbi:triacylglycerol lipase [Homoserinibacter sp. GY 40078]|uniref:esterase/lipase family protein n=1 Tax=Homoserinibacter sp. GY 40078 TaxID=2603275 RepID=UPI0011CBCF7E|nr:alpha/beta hydrolase [Homoserinibacter sp. GY 40078]TXK19777.1 alpha/beta hydrolase [Homoserinibacter sp. GY 40078]
MPERGIERGAGDARGARRPSDRGFARNAAALVGDVPNALRFRARAARDWPVPARYAEGDGRPVLLLPGVYETWHYLRPIAEALHAAGHPVFTVPGLGINHRPIPESAGIAWQRILDLDLADVAVVAHSKGGLIGKHLLAYDDREGRIARVIAVASPFRGTRMAHFAVPPAMREFRPSVPVISALAAERAVNERIVSIAPEWDPHIPDGSALDGARNLTLPVVGHFRILHDPALPGLVVAEVERETT